jgi:methionine--tRNA ligase beta chain
MRITERVRFSDQLLKRYSQDFTPCPDQPNLSIFFEDASSNAFSPLIVSVRCFIWYNGKHLDEHDEGGAFVENITFEYFKNMDLRVAQIKEVEDVPGADRLYKLTLDVGEERQIVAGIKAYYTKEELMGKKIIIVANLEPRTLRGVVSHGMLLAASNEDKSSVVLLTPDKDIPNGATVS